MKLKSTILKQAMCMAIYATAIACVSNDNDTDNYDTQLQLPDNFVTNTLTSEMSWIMENTATKKNYHLGFTGRTLLIKKFKNNRDYLAYGWGQSSSTAIVFHESKDDGNLWPHFITFTKVENERIYAIWDYGNGLHDVILHPVGVKKIAQILQNGPNAESGWNIKNVETQVTNIIKFKSNHEFTMTNITGDILIRGEYIIMSPSEIFLHYERLVPIVSPYYISKYATLNEITSSHIKAEGDFGFGNQHFELN